MDIFLVSFGALLGANTRFYIYKKLEKLNLSKDYVIVVINIFSSFLLGVFLSILNGISHISFSYQLVLFCSIGYLGSLSTFSTFIYDLFALFLQLKFSKALKIYITSVFFGIISIAFGFFLVN
tara:strand:- start:559 stop:927 length:369 start_codon:yes stop_codon:yes gene_type:complete